MKIAILTIGDELLNGELADTNTATVAGMLAEQGYRTREAVTVGDDGEDIVAALQRLARNHDLVLVTGGLGPTEDDRTARAAARAFDRPATLHQDALQQIRERFAAWGRDMHPRNEKQAMLPAKSRVLANRRGTAPGFRIASGSGATLFFFPGVPAEMRPMLKEYVLPFLHEQQPQPVPRAGRVLTVYGLAEPDVEARLASGNLPEDVGVTFAVDMPLVRVKLKAEGAGAERQVDRAELAARQALGDFIVGIDDETLAATTVKLLTTTRLTLALAESCTGGMIAQQITDQPGSSAVLERGAVTYANSAKRDWLGVSTDILEGPGAVSAECATAMAQGIRSAAATDIGLAVTGIAGPSGGTPDKPVGTVYLAMVSPTGEKVERFCFPGDRHQVRMRTACTALDWLRRLALDRAEHSPAASS